MKSFLKWVGGKKNNSTRLLSYFPGVIDRYFEPFLGSGAVLLSLLQSNTIPHHIIAGDRNERLVNLWECVKNRPDELCEICGIVKKKFQIAECKSEFYFAMREQFNKRILNPVEDAAIFLFLNKTGFRGLWRVNKKGVFNVPYGHYTNPSIYDPNIIKNISELLNTHQVEFVCQDYSAIRPTQGDFIYLDPPYMGTYEKYTPEQFEHERFFDFCRQLRADNIPFLVSNSDCGRVRRVFDGCEMIEIERRERMNPRNPEIIACELLIKNI